MVITNGRVYDENFLFSAADLEYEDGRILRVGPAGSLRAPDAIDAKGGYVLPGFVDIHTHGRMGHDFCDGSAEGIVRMLESYGGSGVTSVLATAASCEVTALFRALETAKGFLGAEGHGAVLRGVNLEGPFLNPEKAGAQNPANIIPPSLELFDRLNEQADGQVRLIGIAPEMPGALEFICGLRRRCTVSLAHTVAGYDTALAAFEAGASHVTHLFNAMPPFTHRQPGVVGAASDLASSVELISDGNHVHPSVVRAVFRWFGASRVCLISDSLRAAGLPDGDYDLVGLPVTLRNGRATLSGSDVLAGSVMSLADCCRKAVAFGVPLEQAVRAATLNPARAAGLEREVGSLAPGKRADIVIWDRDLQTTGVIVGGKYIFN